jgi:hypothetical protein
MSKISIQIFDFIASETIKEQLSFDLDELHKSINSECWKSSMVLIGSILETVLYDYINSLESLKNQIKNFEKRDDVALSNLLSWSRKFQVIDENLYRLSEPIRDYRNLIHPKVQERLKTQLSENLVHIGYNVLFEVIRSVKKNHESQLSEKSKMALTKIFVEIKQVNPKEVDFNIYLPILEKYGIELGTKIIERSLIEGGQFE